MKFNHRKRNRTSRSRLTPSGAFVTLRAGLCDWCQQNTPMNIQDYLERKRIDVDQFLDQVIPPAATPPVILHDSMRYSLLGGGKRIRPILTIASAEALGTNPSGLMAVACSLELIHTYSLIHDDLPAMDNDDFRRGKPTNHKVYGEAMAILAGDALLTMAFHLISRPDLMKGCDPVRQAHIIQELAFGSGDMGMVGGQVLDIQAEHQDIDLPTLQNIHKHKTGMLIRAAVRMGAIAGGANDRQLDDMTGYAEDIGLAFQIADDVLNVTSTPEKLGKSAGSDRERGKATYPALHGLEASMAAADAASDAGVREVSLLEKRDFLEGVARFAVERLH